MTYTHNQPPLPLLYLRRDHNALATIISSLNFKSRRNSAIRRQFVLFLVHCRPSQPAEFFARFQLSLFPPGCNSNEVWQELTVIAAEYRTSLDRHGLRLPAHVNRGEVRLLVQYDPVSCGVAADRLWLNLNSEQKEVAASILAAVDAPREQARVMMLQASGGCGKSFVSNYVAARVRSTGKAAICVAASAQAASVLTGGRTAHGQLRIPLDCDDSSYLDLSVSQKNEIANAALLIWDEASMVSGTIADCVSRSFMDIFQNDVPFGGMPVVFCGDFRQLLPVVKGGRGEYHTIQTCAWWSATQMLKLHHNWRSQQPQWLQLLNSVGMGTIDTVEIPPESASPTVEDVVQYVWSDASTGSTQSKAVLTLTLEDAAAVNEQVIRNLPGDGTIALSNDTYMDCKEPDLYPEEFVRSLKISGVAPGQLHLKVGARYIIIRNIDVANGVVNGAHLLCTSHTSRTVSGMCAGYHHCPSDGTAGTLINGEHIGRNVTLPRIAFIITSSQSHLPFAVWRQQFPLIPGYAFTVHRAQGSTLELLGLYINGEPFCHGLLFTALSRVRGDWTKIKVCSQDSTLKNCVKHNVLQCIMQ